MHIVHFLCHVHISSPASALSLCLTLLTEHVIIIPPRRALDIPVSTGNIILRDLIPTSHSARYVLMSSSTAKVVPTSPVFGCSLSLSGPVGRCFLLYFDLDLVYVM